MMDEQELLTLGLAFHGHKCPAMPLGLRAAVAAMRALGVERAQDKELRVISETGKGHAAGCFLDGIMVATGCTYGKSNIEKLYHNKMAFTLVDVAGERAVRVSLKPEFFARMLQSPFVEQRKRGVKPQDIDPAIADPLVAKVMTLAPEEFLEIAEAAAPAAPLKGGVFEARPCSRCAEQVFIDKLVETETGPTCLGCLASASDQERDA